VTARIVVGLSAMLISCRGGPMLPSALGPAHGRTIPLRVSGGRGFRIGFPLRTLWAQQPGKVMNRPPTIDRLVNEVSQLAAN
jgi:hypothetical protein